MERQLKFEKTEGWGGKRTGAGRPNISKTVNHMKRPSVNLKIPLHITLRLRENLPSLRTKLVFGEFKKSVREAKKQGLFVIHFSVQSNHIHLFAEAHGNKSLARGMRSLTIRFAKAFKRESTGKIPTGSVFKGRYHLHPLRTPREVRNGLEYVLLNLSKHQKLIEYMDSFSSARCFGNWPKLMGKRFSSLVKYDSHFYKRQPDSKLKDILSPAQSWLAQVGWMRACS